MWRVVAFVVGLEAIAPAQPSPDQAVEAKRLFEDGRKLATDGKYAPACDDFTKSYALDPGIGTELNLADCQEHLGHTALAWHLFDDAAKRETDPDRGKFARGRADALTAKLASAVVKLPDASTVGLVLKVGGQLVPPAAEVTTRVEPGTVQVELDVPGRPPETRSRPAKAGESVTFDFGAPAAVEPPHPVDQAPPPEETHSVEHRVHSRVVLAAGLGIGGGALIITSGAMAFVAKSHWDAEVGPGKDCDPTVHCNATGFAKVNDARSLANVATVVGIVGLAAAVAGGVVYLTAPKELVVAPAVGAQGGGITLSGTF
ncbi:MAG: hypothetical protein JO257_24840 [Deltaproteobacteria bacterium]|nr:hypothetical protein [Deltaproteobacteria bacterium]